MHNMQARFSKGQVIYDLSVFLMQQSSSAFYVSFLLWVQQVWGRRHVLQAVRS